MYKLKCVHQNQNSTYLKDIQYCKTIKGKERTPSLTAKRPNNRVTPSTVGKAQITFNPSDEIIINRYEYYEHIII